VPKREDEFWAGMKEPKGQGLCPFCGRSDELYYSERDRSWRCGYCEKSFPSPSYGPGGRVELLYCPRCGEKSLFYNEKAAQHECLNLKCKAVGSTLSAIRGMKPVSPHQIPPVMPRATRTRTSTKSIYSGEPRSGGFPGWLKPVVVIVLLVMSAAVIQGLWGREIAEFFSGAPSTSAEEGTSLPSAENEATVGGGGESPSVENGVTVFEGRQPPFSKTFAGERIHLVNNSATSDPTWQELMAFLIADETDQKDYSLFSYPCGAFAEEVHNNAEATNIRAAWVTVYFSDASEWHALNAFHTIDSGLVFVDCTSSYHLDIVYPLMIDPATGQAKEWKPERLSSYDKIAYVVVGKEYGQIGLNVATSPEYSFYDAYLLRQKEYNSKVEAYNQEADAYTRETEAYNQEVDAYIEALGGRVYLEEPEYSRFMTWKSRLDSELAELMAWKSGLDSTLVELEAMVQEIGNFSWLPLGVVSTIEIYW